MYQLEQTRQFKKDIKLAKKRGLGAKRNNKTHQTHKNRHTATCFK